MLMMLMGGDEDGNNDDGGGRGGGNAVNDEQKDLCICGNYTDDVTEGCMPLKQCGLRNHCSGQPEVDGGFFSTVQKVSCSSALVNADGSKSCSCNGRKEWVG